MARPLINRDWKNPEYYWSISSPHGLLIVGKEAPDIAGIPPIHRNNMDLDCFELAQLFAANLDMQKQCPVLWQQLHGLVIYTHDTWMQKVQDLKRLQWDNMVRMPPPKIEPAPRKARPAPKPRPEAALKINPAPKKRQKRRS
jgi:hypothetical protein